MRDISKAAFYSSYFEIANKLEAADRLQFYDSLFNYIFLAIEPANLSPIVDIVFTAVKPIADADIKRKDGGAPLGNKNAKKQLKTTTENNLKQLVDLKKTNNVNVNDNDNVNVNENGNTTDIPLAVTPSTANYSKIIFELFKNAGLPCSRNNEISFLQTDFNNALRYLHETEDYKHIHSDDVIGAVKNYIEVVNSSASYLYGKKWNFLQLVKSKVFYQLLPANYDFKSFQSYKKEDAKTPADAPKKIFYYDCPICHQKTRHLIQGEGSYFYFCDSCNRRLTEEELQNV